MQERHDVRVLERGGELDLAAEAVDAHACGHLGWQDFDDDAPRELHLFCQEDAAHATAAQLPLDPIIGAERRSQALQEVPHAPLS